MSPAPTPLTRLDLDTLRTFVDNDVRDGFVKLLAALQEDAVADGPNPHGVPSMRNLLAQFSDPVHGFTSAQFKLGRLANADGKLGPLTALPLMSALKTSTTELSTVVDDQKRLFDDIKTNLETVMESMKKAQQDSLDDIDSQSFLNDLRNVDTDLAGTQKKP
ncbi:type VII secretion system-associated protein [Streptomyces sp. NPDC001941]|uniref:type VII secretion system-associated protein n=1 Tax=Streptomyces sp. NPDC001941 TaxID=3154659 RepID=UPI00332EFFD2